MIQRQPGAGSPSPSLVARARARGPAYELKFLVRDAEVERLSEWFRDEARLAPDPCAEQDADVPGSYTTTTLYLDTPGADVYRRSPGYRTQKFRVRRYGASSALFLERKRKADDRVSKRRAAISEDEIGTLAEPSSPVEWAGHWFQRMINTRRLAPAACLAYRRTALVGVGVDGPIRVTMDRAIRGCPADAWEVRAPDRAEELLPGVVVLELKFVGALPVAYKRAMDEFRLTPTGVSKYRLWRASTAP